MADGEVYKPEIVDTANTIESSDMNNTSDTDDTIDMAESSDVVINS